MLEVLLAMGLPTVVFGAFALLAVWLGADSRPWFDERPVIDDRPNWWPMRRRSPAEEEPPDDDHDDGVAIPAEPLPQPRPAAPVSAATSPSGVWSAASMSGS